MLTQLSPELLRPGSWVAVAQDALDRCARAITTDDIVRDFGSARALAEAVLGFPIAGGHATKTVVRSVGRLVTHHLGPALAADALSWAASASEVIDTASIESLLEHATHAVATFRPLDLENRQELHDLLLLEPRMRARRGRLIETWDRSVEDEDTSWWNPEWASCGLFTTDLEWLLHRSYSASLTPEQQTRARAQSPDLFKMDDDVIARCLLEVTPLVLSNRACPTALKDLIRNPYDDATLELALRAGPKHVARDRLTRRLQRLDADRMRDLASRIPAQLLFALRSNTAVTAELFLGGPLSGVDISDPDILTAAFGGSSEWLDGRMPAALVRLLEEHPANERLAIVLDVASAGAIDDDAARRLVATAPRTLAIAALRHLASLAPEHAGLAMGAGMAVQARCPGIAAADRPIHHNSAFPPPAPTKLPERFDYPSELWALETASFAGGAEWTITLPRNLKHLERNALYMENCTAGYADDIAAGSVAILIVTAPDGTPYNVSLTRSQSRWYVGQVNGRFNDGDEPEWIRPALEAHLSAIQAPSCRADDARPQAGRPPTDRRDRRRRRASAARRRRR